MSRVFKFTFDAFYYITLIVNALLLASLFYPPILAVPSSLNGTQILIFVVSVPVLIFAAYLRQFATKKYRGYILSQKRGPAFIMQNNDKRIYYLDILLAVELNFLLISFFTNVVLPFIILIFLLVTFYIKEKLVRHYTAL